MKIIILGGLAACLALSPARADPIYDVSFSFTANQVGNISGTTFANDGTTVSGTLIDAAAPYDDGGDYPSTDLFQSVQISSYSVAPGIYTGPITFSLSSTHTNYGQIDTLPQGSRLSFYNLSRATVQLTPEAGEAATSVVLELYNDNHGTNYAQLIFYDASGTELTGTEYSGQTGDPGAVTYSLLTPETVPEPSSLAILGMALLAGFAVTTGRGKRLGGLAH